MCGAAPPPAGKRPRLASQGEQGRVWTYSHISAGARLFPLKLTSFCLQKRDTSALLASLHEKTFYAQPERLRARTPTKKRDSNRHGNPGRTFRPSCSSSAQFGLRVFLVQTSLMSLGVFFLILKYAFQETELRCSPRTQRPLPPVALNAGRSGQILKFTITKYKENHSV